MVDNNTLLELLNNKEITTSELKLYGFSSYDINKLIANNYLTRIKRGEYSINLDNLFEYGINFINDNNYDMAYNYLIKCCELDFKYIDKCYEMFCENILIYNTDIIFLFLEILLSFENKYIPNINLYMYLLSFIIEIPERYKEYIKSIELEDIFSVDEDINNNVRKKIYSTKFNDAFSELNNGCKDSLILKTLLARNITVDRTNRVNILNLVKEKKYNELNKYLQNKLELNNLTVLETKIELLLDNLLFIKSTGKIPKIEIENTNNIFEAINKNNFKLALQLSNKFSSDRKFNNENNVVYLLLKEICEEIDKLSYYFDIIINVTKNNYENTYSLIDKYLEYNNKKQYNVLLKNYIKICINENDLCFKKFIMILSEIDRDVFNFNLNEYVKYLYLSLSQNNIDKANLYLDIIINSKDLVQDEDLKNNLINILNTSKEIIKENEEKIMEQEQKIKIQTNNNNIHTNDENYKIFLAGKHRELVENKGIIVLEGLNSKQRRDIHLLCKNYEDMVCFNIGEDENKKIVLRYNPKHIDFVDIKKLGNESNLYFQSNEYKKSLSCLLKILSFGLPKAYIYAKIGLIYIKLNKNDLAIDYLETATYLSKKENTFLDYTKLIKKLKNNEEISVDEKLFQSKSNTIIFSLDNIDKIKEYIYKSDLDVESACLKLNFNTQQINLIKLSIAQDYYSQNNFVKGDEFVLSVEKSEDKSKIVLNLINELRKNKRFFSNRENKCIKKLSLSLKPNK